MRRLDLWSILTLVANTRGEQSGGGGGGTCGSMYCTLVYSADVL